MTNLAIDGNGEMFEFIEKPREPCPQLGDQFVHARCINRELTHPLRVQRLRR